MSERPPDAVLLIHGTFAHSVEDDLTNEAGRARWWQEGSDFTRELDALLAGQARCWPADACAAMPWARRSLGHRIETWTILGRRPFAWFRPRVRITSRRLFAWSGMNSDAERRKAGRRLYRGLRRLEAMGRPYHLIGHSHGGTVIRHALHLAARRGQELPGMRSWTTLGTPFTTYGPVWSQGLVGLLGLAAIGLIANRTFVGGFVELPRPLTWETSWATVMALFWWESPANLYPRGVSVATAGFLMILLVLVAWLTLAIALWVARSIEYWFERRDSERAWRYFGGRWLGLFSEIDEAIAGTQNTVGLYVQRVVRLPWPAPSRVVKFLALGVATYLVIGFSFMISIIDPLDPSPLARTLLLLVVVILLFNLGKLASALAMNWAMLPLAEWVISQLLRMRFQGARVGTCLMLTSPEPFSRRSFPDEPTRGPLPKELSEPLHAMAREKVQGRMAKVRARFAEDARGPLTPKALLREYFSGLKLTNELVHNSYYDVTSLRRAIAYQIRKSACGAAPDDLARELDGVVAWLDGARPAPLPRDYLPERKPPITTPVWTRLLLAASVLLVSYLALAGLRFDVREVFAPRLADRAAYHTAQWGDRPREIDLAIKVFRPVCEPQLVRLTKDDPGTDSRLSALKSLNHMLGDLGDKGPPVRLDGPAAVAVSRQTSEQLLELAINEKDAHVRSAALMGLFLAVQDGRYAEQVIDLIRLKGFGRASHSGDLRVLLISWDNDSAVPGYDNCVIAGTDGDGLLHIRANLEDAHTIDAFETRDRSGALHFHLAFDDTSLRDQSDEPESDLPPTKAGALAAFKQRLPGLLPPHVLTLDEKIRVINELSSIVGWDLGSENAAHFSAAEIATLMVMGPRGAGVLADIAARYSFVSELRELDSSTSAELVHLGDARPWSKRALGVITADTGIPLERLAPGLDATDPEILDAAENAKNFMARERHANRPLINCLRGYHDLNAVERAVSLVRPRAVPKPD